MPTLAARRPATHPPETLASFNADDGVAREVCVLDAGHGVRLVVDRRRADASDQRLVARLDPSEPGVNARIVCDQYLAHPRGCRLLTEADLAPASSLPAPQADLTAPVQTRDGRRFRLGPVARGELRWTADLPGGASCVVSTRRVIGALESYEPVRTLSQAAIALHRRSRAVAITTLGAELKRIDSSPIVLNRLLREAVLETVGAGLTMSAIALRCGRIKRDQRGNVSGETSWLARRIGLLPDGGAGEPTPWVHSDVLALIARRGLGIDPREVELG